MLFDLDGTLVDSERESAEAMARAMKNGLGIEISQADRDFIIGRSWVEIYQNLIDGYGEGLSWSKAELIAETSAERANVFAEVGITVLPGAVAAVDRFAHLKRTIVTGSSRVECRQALVALGLQDTFDAVYASEDYPAGKPAPDGYIAAANAVEVAIGECVVIEDSAAGIASGRAAGAFVVAVRAGNFYGQDQSAAHVIIDELDQLTPDLLASLGQKG